MDILFDVKLDYLREDIIYYIKRVKPDKKICLICHFSNDKYDKYKLSCKHVFHTNCFRRYCGYKNCVKCPLCDVIKPYKEFKDYI